MAIKIWSSKRTWERSLSFFCFSFQLFFLSSHQSQESHSFKQPATPSFSPSSLIFLCNLFASPESEPLCFLKTQEHLSSKNNILLNGQKNHLFSSQTNTLSSQAKLHSSAAPRNLSSSLAPSAFFLFSTRFAPPTISAPTATSPAPLPSCSWPSLPNGKHAPFF